VEGKPLKRFGYLILDDFPTIEIVGYVQQIFIKIVKNFKQAFGFWTKENKACCFHD